MLMALVLLAQLNDSAAQRASIVERLKALDKGIRQGLQRQRTELPTSTSPQVTLPSSSADEHHETATHAQHTAVNSLQGLGPKPAESIIEKSEQQLSVSPEDADGTSDVVRQLTESYEEEEEQDEEEVRLFISSMIHVNTISRLVIIIYRIRSRRTPATNK